MPFDAPLTLGPFTVAPDGRLVPTDSDRFPRFRLDWRGRHVEANLVTMPDSGGAIGQLRLCASLGRVPSTASDPHGAPRPTRRDIVFATLRDLPPELPSGWRLILLPDHQVTLAATLAIDLPTNVTTLLAGITQFLLTLGPYLDLLDETGVEPSAAGAGTVNTCPG